MNLDRAVLELHNILIWGWVGMPTRTLVRNQTSDRTYNDHNTTVTPQVQKLEEKITVGLSNVQLSAVAAKVVRLFAVIQKRHSEAGVARLLTGFQERIVDRVKVGTRRCPLAYLYSSVVTHTISLLLNYQRYFHLLVLRSPFSISSPRLSLVSQLNQPLSLRMTLRASRLRARRSRRANSCWK